TSRSCIALVFSHVKTSYSCIQAFTAPLSPPKSPPLASRHHNRTKPTIFWSHFPLIEGSDLTPRPGKSEVLKLTIWSSREGWWSLTPSPPQPPTLEATNGQIGRLGFIVFESASGAISGTSPSSPPCGIRCPLCTNGGQARKLGLSFGEEHVLRRRLRAPGEARGGKAGATQPRGLLRARELVEGGRGREVVQTLLHRGTRLNNSLHPLRAHLAAQHLQRALRDGVTLRRWLLRLAHRGRGGLRLRER
ncbi:hypothetical protein T484DRAFT_2372757, partial [Baffinella frigidus]